MTEMLDLHIFQMSERALLITWENKVGEDLLSFLIRAKSKLLEKKENEIVDIFNTYNALLLKYKKRMTDINKEKERLKTILKNMENKESGKSTLYRIPLCYDKKFGLDLREIMGRKQLSRQEIITLHSQPIYTVYFTGFLPGFPYLGGLSEELFMDRKRKPRKQIPEGAVGIGGRQTGIYPSVSPGGWQLIGNSPISLFNVKNTPPCLFRAGDRIRFFAVSLKEHQAIKKDILSGKYHLKKETWK